MNWPRFGGTCFIGPIRVRIVRARGRLDDVKTRLGCRTVATGGMDKDNPEVPAQARMDPLAAAASGPVFYSTIAPAIVGLLREPDRTRRLRHRLALRRQHFELPQLGDDLLRLGMLSI